MHSLKFPIDTKYFPFLLIAIDCTPLGWNYNFFYIDRSVPKMYMPADYFYTSVPASEDSACDSYSDDDDKSTFCFFVGLNYETHINFL